MSDKSVSRRNFIKGTALAGTAGVLGASSLTAGSTEATNRAGAKRAKNLIFLVADGMCHGTLGFAHHWSLANRKTPLNWIQLYDRDGLNLAIQDTASASSPVTDSAAAASAWGSGTRVMNRSINTTASGESLTPIMKIAKEAGKKTGLVSTCRITHATPAGFTASVSHRNDEDQIARQYLEREVDLILGGGYTQFNGEKQNIIPDYEEAGYAVCRTRGELAEAKGSARVLGLFSDSHIPYALDRKNDSALAEIPSLMELFEHALENLSGSEDGFVLQVEAGRIDHAGHANDPGSILHEQLEYDACIPIALNYIEKNPETMLIVTTDHGCGGCQLDGIGSSYNESGPALESVNVISQSFEWVENAFRKSGKVDAEIIKSSFGINPTSEQIDQLQAALVDPSVRYFTSVLGAVLDNELAKMTGIGWTSNAHTAENVELLAFGPGAEQVSGFMKNYEVFSVMTGALGLKV